MSNSNNPLHYEIQYLKGVGQYRAQLLNKLNINTIGDLLEHFPRDYINRKSQTKISNFIIGERNAIIGEISSIEKKKTSRKKEQLNISVTDGRDYLICTWFRFGVWLLKKFEIGQKIWVSGMVSEFQGTPQIIHPEIEILDSIDETTSFWHSRSVLPVYPLTEKISTTIMRTIIHKAFELYHDAISETLPESIIKSFNYIPRKIALQKMHFTTNPDEIPAIRQRFAFEELFYYQIMLARSKRSHQDNIIGYSFSLHKTYTTKLKNSLPFQLTGAQKRVIREIVADMNAPTQMNRLLQGDVGSGKTIVTLFAMLLAVENGFQAILMAPTEILAEQHYRSFCHLLQNQPKLKITLLKGGNYKGKAKTKEEIAAGEINIIIGTHALIQKDMRYKNVGFVAIDEQHRFGVEQRAVLSKNNKHPDLMYLSATPIPRSLALTVYGDLNISILDELPPGRKPVKTIWRNSQKLNLIYSEIEIQLKAGRQVYFVSPLIQESEKSDLKAAETIFENIEKRIFPSYKTTLLHGQMKTADKDQIMEDFKAGKYQIIVATTVIEVGIDVPNATVMVIEHAERFGLSQLHQLRGRVGRGHDLSTCYLIAYPPISNDGRERLSTMVETTDGFKIAEKDLELRGPGEFFGTNQSGMPVFKHANLVRDQELLKQARVLAFDIIEKDSQLELPENKLLKTKYFAQYLSKEKLFDF